MTTTWQAVERMDGFGTVSDGELFHADVRYAIGIVAEYAADETPTSERRLNGRVWVIDDQVLRPGRQLRLLLADKRVVNMLVLGGPDPEHRYYVMGTGEILD